MIFLNDPTVSDITRYFFPAVLVDVAVCKLSLRVLLCTALYVKMLSLSCEMDGVVMQLSLITCWSKAPEIECEIRSPLSRCAFPLSTPGPECPAVSSPEETERLHATDHERYHIHHLHICDVSGSYVTIHHLSHSCYAVPFELLKNVCACVRIYGSIFIKGYTRLLEKRPRPKSVLQLFNYNLIIFIQ